MKTKQTINILGATGNMGSAIAKSLARGNYKLLLWARDIKKVEELVSEIQATNSSADVEAISCTEQSCWEADIIILATPYQAEKELAECIKELANQKIVISISNPLNESFDGLVTEPNTSGAEELQKLLPNSKIVKAFNTTFAADFSHPDIDHKQVDAFIAGNDEDSLKVVEELVVTAGFNPIVAGKLSVSRTLESMQLLLIQLGLKYNYNWHAGWKILHN